ncbi:MAG: TerB family tellurite resistance protein, partial [Gammaproteobacteria bacterium]
MLNSIKQFFENHIHSNETTSEEVLERRLRVATVALLLETARADFNVQDEELQAVARNAQRFFGLNDEEASEL